MGVTFNSGDGATSVQQKLYAQAINYLSHYSGMGDILHDLATMDVNIRFIYNGASCKTIRLSETASGKRAARARFPDAGRVS